MCSGLSVLTTQGHLSKNLLTLASHKRTTFYRISLHEWICLLGEECQFSRDTTLTHRHTHTCTRTHTQSPTAHFFLPMLQSDTQCAAGCALNDQSQSQGGPIFSCIVCRGQSQLVWCFPALNAGDTQCGIIETIL